MVQPSSGVGIRCGVVGCGEVRPPRSSSRRLRAGQPGCGGRSFGLEHASVGLTDVAVPGDGGGLVKV